MLFQAVVERPPAERAAFLAATVGGDEALRREVESLLDSDSADVSVADRLTFAAEAGNSPGLLQASLAQPQLHPTLGVGRRIGSYEVVAALGAGAMGEVYRARDTKL